MVRSSCPWRRSTVIGKVSIDDPSVAPETHHGWPVARPKLSPVGCTATRKRAGGVTPVSVAMSSRDLRTSVVTAVRSDSSLAGNARATSEGANGAGGATGAKCGGAEGAGAEGAGADGAGLRVGEAEAVVVTCVGGIGPI